MQFVAYGHPGIEGTHKTAFELTQSTGVIPKGDRVVGTRAGFDAEALAALAQASKKLRITLKARTYSETIIGEANNGFAPGPEVVIRKDNAISPRTLVFNADRSAADFSRKFIQALQNPEEQVLVVLERA